MTQHFKQHLIDPEICIRCYTCEEACPIDAITHDDNNVVVDAAKCDQCMNCIAPCPTGSIDNWRVVAEPYSLQEQFGWMELPEQAEISETADGSASLEALDDTVAQLIAEAHSGTGGKARAPASASKPSINLYTQARPAKAVVQGNFRLTGAASDSDVRHIILDLGDQPFPVLEGQSVGICAPGLDEAGKPHRPRLYSVSSPRDGERPNTNNLSLTVKREPGGVCSNYLCDLQRGDSVELTGPFGATFLMPNDPQANLLMICTGTGSAPFRAFTMRRMRMLAGNAGGMTLIFGARTPQCLPYFGPLRKIPDTQLRKHLVFSRCDGRPKEYVQDRLLTERKAIASILSADNSYIYVCGLRAMESGIEGAFFDIAKWADLDWATRRNTLREEGRYHVETY